MGRLTFYQIRRVILRPRDKDWNIERDPRAGRWPDPREDFIERWMRWGLSRRRAERKWLEELKDQGEEQPEG